MAANLGALATPIVVAAHPDTSCADAARLMRQHHVGSLVVVASGANDSKPLGMITDRDLVLAVMAEDLDPKLFTVGDVMSTPLVTAHTSTDLLEAVTLLGRHRLRRLVVTDDTGRLVGVAAMEDLLEAVAREMGTLAFALRGARDRERQQRG
jgi:CBS domain-containing protein